jgi:hypothetical protein
MSDSTTTNYGWAYPTVNADANTWGTTLNSALIAIDGQVHANAAAACQVANNLSELAATAATARSNLGLGSAATQSSSAFDAAGAASAAQSAAISAAASNTSSAISAQGLRIGTAAIFVQVGGSPPAMNNGDICVIL